MESENQSAKKKFLSTTGLNEWSVRSWASFENADQLGQCHRDSTYYSRSEDDREFLRKEFLEKLPKLPSLYCRSNSSRMYLEPTIKNKNQLYQLYVDKCKDEGKKPLSRRILQEESDKLNISVFHPRKDQCDTCVAYEAGNIPHEEWEKHREDIDEARLEKCADKLAAACEVDKTLVVTMDLQAVLLSPRLMASALYYKTKLCVHNFTMYNLVTRDVTCYVWHEGEGGLTANEFASCILDYMSDHPHYDKYVLYSDSCTYQNRNAILSNALNDFARQTGKTVEQTRAPGGLTLT